MLSFKQFNIIPLLENKKLSKLNNSLGVMHEILTGHHSDDTETLHKIKDSLAVVPAKHSAGVTFAGHDPATGKRHSYTVAIKHKHGGFSAISGTVV